MQKIVRLLSAWFSFLLLGWHAIAWPAFGQDQFALRLREQIVPYSVVSVVKLSRRSVQEETYNLLVTGGGGSINAQGQSAQVIVQVRDRNNMPTAGVAVLFILPEDGPGGVFPDGGNQTTILTDVNGEANATFQAEGLGPFEIQVEIEGQRLLTVAQTNVIGAAVAGGLSSTALLILVVGGAAAAGVGLALRGGGGNTGGGNDGLAPPVLPPPTTTVTLGTPRVGPPRGQTVMQ